MTDPVLSGSGDALFTLEPVQLQFPIEAAIKRLLVANNRLCLVLANGIVHRINLENPEKVDEIQIPLENDTIHDAYIDRKGYHLIVQTTKNSFHYLNYQANKSRELSKLRGYSVSGIAFLDKHVHGNTTGPMLVCVTSGALYEVNVESGRERTVKQVYKARAGIQSVCIETISNKSHVVTYTVICALTTNKLVQFIAKIPLNVQAHQSALEHTFKRDPTSFNFNSLLHMTSSDRRIAFLDLSPEDSSYQITYGDINFRSKKELDHFKLDSSVGTTIASIMLTKYYVLLLTTHNELLIYNQLNGLQSSSQQLDGTNEKFVDFTADHAINTYWLYSPDAIYEIVVDNENAGIWKIMMERGMYDEAVATLKFPQGADSDKLDIIMINKGKYLLKHGNYDKAAEILAATSEPMEDIALKFIDAERPKPLRTYLTNKLRILPKTLYMQRVIVASWLVELFMEGLNELESRRAGSESVLDNNDESSKEADQKVAKEKEVFLREFYSFLDEFKESLDKETVYQIIMSHNRQEELLYFANLINDYTFVLKYYLNQQKWEESLKVLSLQKDPNLVYRCSTVLFVNYPVKTCDTWIRLIDDLDYLKLLPALLTYNKTVVKARGIEPQYNQALRFLNFLIQERKVKDNLIHNTILTVFISYPGATNEDLILNYLENQKRAKNMFGASDEYEILFDPDYILRLCFHYNKIQSAIYVYSMMKDYENAVSLALKHDLLELAVVVADKPSSDTSIHERKNLWLKISSKMIKKVVNDDTFIDEHKLMFQNAGIEPTGNKISDVLKFLMTKCDLLSMKDLLPLFPDFVVIDNFKREVVDSLQQLSSEMSHLSVEMTESINESDKINEQIDNFKNNSFQIIEPYESCMLCNKILTSRKFIVFPCYHSFHQDCLAKQILKSNDYKLKSQLYSLQKKMEQAKGSKELMTELKEQTSETLSKKCVLCTDMKINEIEQPLLVPGDREEAEWAI